LYPETLRKSLSEEVMSLDRLNMPEEQTIRQSSYGRAEVGEEILEHTLFSLSDAFVALDQEWRYIYANQKAAEVIGLSLDAMIGKVIWDVLPDLRGGRFEEACRRAMSEQTPLQYENFFVRMGRWYENRLYPSPDRLSIFTTDITDRKNAEMAQHESEMRFRTIFEANLIGIGFWEGDGSIASANDALLEILGYTREDLNAGNIRWANLTPPELRTLDEHAIQETLAKGRSTPYEKEYIRKDGTRVPVLVGGIFFEHDPSRGAFFALDISQRKQAEEAARKAHEELTTTLDRLDDPFFMLDKEWRFTYLNRRSLNASGQPQEALIGKRIWDVYPQLRGTVYEKNCRLAMRKQTAIHFESQSLTTSAIYEVSVYPSPEGISVYSRDITERRRADRQLHYLAEISKVLSSSLDYEVTLQRVADLMVPHMADWCSVDMLNDEGSVDLMAVAHIDPAKVAWAWELRSQQKPRMDEPRGLANVLRTGQSELYAEIPEELILAAARNEEELALIRQIGFKSIVIVPLQAHGQVLGGLTLVWSETDRRYNENDVLFAEEVAQRAAMAVDNARLYRQARHAEAQLKQLNEGLELRVAERTAELQRRNQELDQFAYVASHDLRSPLRGIDLLATWITEDAGELLPPTCHDHIQRLHGRVGRMERLLDDLLSYSRADRQQSVAEEIDTAKLVATIVDLLTPPPGFRIVLEGEMPVIVTEPVPLEVVIRNIVDNAIKHHHHPQEGLVRISAQDQDEFVSFCIADNGPGIAPQFHDRVFQVFQTLKPRDQVEGSGMGLAVVRKVLESRGGSIRIESDEGQGAAFTFIWPKTPVQPNQLGA
jgi:PAS domain S-box-containing protein